MYKFFERRKLSGWTQEEIRIRIKKLNSRFKSVLWRRFQMHMALLVNSVKYLRKKSYPFYRKPFKNTGRGNTSDLLYEARITLIPMPDEKIRRKKLNLRANIMYDHRSENSK